jgi:hypothetical protein
MWLITTAATSDLKRRSLSIEAGRMMGSRLVFSSAMMAVCEGLRFAVFLLLGVQRDVRVIVYSRWQLAGVLMSRASDTSSKETTFRGEGDIKVSTMPLSGWLL